MDDLNQQISQFLSDPNNMRQLQSVMSSLGIGGGQEESSPKNQNAPSSPSGNSSTPDLSALAGMLGALGGGNSNQNQSPPQNQMIPGADSLAMAAKLAPLLGQLNQEDDSTRLLRALRPMLSEARREKIDEAVKILQLMRLLPMLRELGGLPGLF